MKHFYTLILSFVLCALINAQCPSVTVTPLTKTITCNGAPATFTAVSNPTTAVFGQWFGPGGVPMNAPTASPLILSANNPGTYTVAFINIFSSCVTTQTVTVLSNSIVPSMTVNALGGYSLACNCLPFNITNSTGPAPITYTWTNLTTSVVTTPALGGYTVCPGGGSSHLAEFQNGNACRVSQRVELYMMGCVSGINELGKNDNILVYPNPSNGKFIVNIIDAVENAELSVKDNLGKEVLKQKVNEGINTINLSGKAPGIYHYSIVKDKTSIGKGKMIVQ